MQVIVSGGSGLIGRALVAGLAADGHRATVLSRSPERLRDLPAGVTAAAWDAKSVEELTPLVAGADAVVHLAGEGIAEGRWNLSVDFKSGVVNIPAVRGFGKAVRVRIDEIVGLELRTLISAHESDLDRSIFRFNVICEHEDTKWHPDGTENRETQLVAYTAAQSEDHAKLRAMAEWFNDSAGLGLPIEASACDGSALAQMSEANSYKRVVKVGS